MTGQHASLFYKLRLSYVQLSVKYIWPGLKMDVLHLLMKNGLFPAYAHGIFEIQLKFGEGRICNFKTLEKYLQQQP